jgi:predicted RNase H-like HicB family nuclease
LTTLTEALQRTFPLTRDVHSVGDKTSEVRLAVHVEREPLDGYWIASCPELPGAVSQGSTGAEAMNNLADAVDAIVRLKLRDRYRRIRLRAVAEPAAEGEGILTTIISV